MPQKEKKVWSPPINKNKTWNITYWPSYGYSSNKTPNLHSSVHIQLGFNASFPLSSMASGKQRAGRERWVGKNSDSTSPCLLVVTGPTCCVSSCSWEAAKATAQQVGWLGQRNCFPPLQTKALSRAANISALKTTCWVAGVNSQALCCYQSQVLFFKQWHTRSCIQNLIKI